MRDTFLVPSEDLRIRNTALKHTPPPPSCGVEYTRMGLVEHHSRIQN